jgi:hemerythrin superfamily protein
MSAVEMLISDHDKVMKLFDDFDADNSKEIAEKIFREIEIHAQLEEQIFYPAVESIDNELISESLADHNMVKDMIEELRGMDITDEEFPARFEELRASIEDHVAVEETELFPEVESNLSKDLDRLGLEMQKLKDQLEQGTATRTKSA